MDLVIIGVLAGVVLITVVVIGSLFVLLRKESQKTDDKAVPITDLTELKKEYVPAPVADLPQETKNEILSLIKEQERSSVVQTPAAEEVPQEPIPEDLAAAKQKLAELEKDVVFVDRQSKPESQAQRTADPEHVKALEEENAVLNEKIVNQAQDALKVIQKLTKENEELRKQLSEPASAVAADPQQAEELRKEFVLLNQELSLKNERIQQLEAEVAALSEESAERARQEQAPASQPVASEEVEQIKNDNRTLKESNAELVRQIEEKTTQLTMLKQQLEAARADESVKQRLDESIAIIDSLQKKNELLSEQLEAGTTKAQQLELQIVTLEKELKTQLDEAYAMIHELKLENSQMTQNKHSYDEMEANQKRFKEEMEAKVAEANRTVMEMRAENQKILQAKMELDDRLNNLILESTNQNSKNYLSIQQLTDENATLQQSKADLEQTVEKLKEFNKHLIQKSEILQYELTKHRAQSVGLEKICDAFKNQVDQMMGEMNGFKATNEQLSQEKNVLEENISRMRKERETLLRREQEAEQELQQSRQQINRLEKIYNEFKVRLENQNGTS